MNKIICIPKITVLIMSALMLTCLSQARAQGLGFEGDKRAEVKLEDWQCEYCPKPEVWDMSLAVHFGVTDEEVYRFANYTGLDRQSQLFFSGDIKMQTEDGHYWSTHFRNLGLDSLALDSAYGKQGSYRLGVDYLAIPVRKYAHLLTPYSNKGGMLQLPGDWPTSADARDFADLSLYRPLATGTDWKRLGLELSLNEDDDFSFDSRYQRWHKTGTLEYSAAQLLNASYLPLPVDQTIQDLSASMSYNRESWLLSLSAAFSRFDNELDSLRFANPYEPLAAGADSGQLALAPDNNALKLTLHGQYRYARDSFVKLNYVFGKLTQDQAFVPYTDNANLLTALPQTDLEGKVNTSDLTAQLNHRWDRAWAVRIKYRYRERDNKTAPLLLRPVISDLYVADALMTLPYDYSTRSASATLEYRPMAGHLLNLGYKNEEKERNLQAVHNTNEAGFNANYAATFSPEWMLKLSGERLNRDSSTPERLDFLGVEENPLMRRFNVADRQQDSARLQLFYTPSEQVSATVSGQYSHQDYVASELGLKDNKLHNANLDLSWHPNETFDISLFLQQEDIKTRLAGSDDFSGPRWQARNQDKITSYGISLALRKLLDDKLSLFINFDRADAHTYIRLDQAGGSDALPTIASLWSHGELKMLYQYSTHTELSFSYQYQAFDSADFAIDGVTPGSLPNLLTFGTSSNNYNVSYGLVSVGYKF
ncbi:MtrB/PioB family decaheme-associated outer membrane protein [Shewanella salipaludis]|uniref:MtrB/PioB family decaheme-associated outer membrane protein n=1 Tax=Shewanella salipaludis TaxID=2723052 RepID=A0A972G0N0_9GAMM|nr:MtrB/PioB family decaheme-associated outer membrane protein [Shewanella salipaludis]NMH66658.1 MtrB/PioB family decaheme-associated outer membrane protein [Shewanella salipaludis]